MKCYGMTVECNLEPTDYTTAITDAFLKGKSGETLPKLLNHLQQFQ